MTLTRVVLVGWWRRGLTAAGVTKNEKRGIGVNELTDYVEEFCCKGEQEIRQ